MATTSTSPYQRLDPSQSSITPDDVLNQFRSHGFVWIRQNNVPLRRNATDTKGASASIMHSLRRLYAQDTNVYSKKWAVENRGNYASDDELGAESILGGCSHETMRNGPYYVSTIIEGRDHAALKGLFELLPFGGKGVPSLLQSSRHDGGCWLFIGDNPPDDVAAESFTNRSVSSASETNKKRKRPGPHAKALAGRAEHVDEVEHSGTWHMQLSGSKTWLIRPNSGAVEDWGGDGCPDVSESEFAEETERKAWRLNIKVEEGDLFILNTRAWYHRTELESSVDISASVARDFYLPAKQIYAHKDIERGDVVLDEEELPFDIPRSDSPNCALAEVFNDTSYDIDGNDHAEDIEKDECSIVLISLRNLKKGEALTIASEENDGDSHLADDRCNAPDAVDPRAICRQSAKKGDILLRNEEIPEELFCSPSDPSCEVVEVGDDVVLRTLRDISEGEVMSVAPTEGVEYEEIEVDVETGELIT